MQVKQLLNGNHCIHVVKSGTTKSTNLKTIVEIKSAFKSIATWESNTYANMFGGVRLRWKLPRQAWSDFLQFLKKKKSKMRFQLNLFINVNTTNPINCSTLQTIEHRQSQSSSWVNLKNQWPNRHSWILPLPKYEGKIICHASLAHNSILWTEDAMFLSLLHYHWWLNK